MKIRIKKKKRKIIIDDYFHIGGAVIPNLKCEKCDGMIIYYDRYDDEFCPYCNQWLTPQCGDSDCIFFAGSVERFVQRRINCNYC